MAARQALDRKAAAAAKTRLEAESADRWKAGAKAETPRLAEEAKDARLEKAKAQQLTEEETKRAEEGARLAAESEELARWQSTEAEDAPLKAGMEGQ